jgi:hypothetical protein
MIRKLVLGTAALSSFRAFEYLRNCQQIDCDSRRF